jgi:uroporphyrinogen-III synthase
MTLTSRKLEGVTVLVTRPAGQAEGLCRAIESAGGKSVSFPLIEIQSIDDAATPQKLQEAVTRSAGVLFVSRNAVKYAIPLLSAGAGVLVGKSVYAVGAGTRRALLDQGLTDVISTDATRASEALLELPALTADNIGGTHITIVCGEGGRKLLADELQRRGATVHKVVLYRRVLPNVTPEQVHALWDDVRPDIMVITSATGLYNLVEITAESDKPVLLHTRLVVMSERIADVAAALGFTGWPVIATKASDAGLVEAIVECTELSKDDR